MKKVFSLDFQLQKVTGIEKVMLDIHHAVKNDYEARIVGNLQYQSINKDHGISKEEYLKFRNPFMFYNSIVFVHDRRFLLPLWILNTFFFQRIHIVYVHHNVLVGNKLLTVFPKNVVAISDSGIRNLIDYFGVEKNNITKIHNCVVDQKPDEHKVCEGSEISVLYPARINRVKRQVEIVEKLKGKIDKRVKIYFAGEGPLLDELQESTKFDEQFVTLGYRADVLKLMQKCDYMMLFSTQEGLPITLIEATMCGTPIVCNGVGGNEEIAINGENAFVAPTPDDYDWLVNTLNSLPNVSNDEYKRMCSRSREVYRDNYTYDLFKQKYLELLNTI